MAESLPILGTASLGTVITSTPVAVVNLTGEAMFGRAYVVRHQFGAIVVQPPVTVLTGNSSATVQAVAYTNATRHIH